MPRKPLVFAPASLAVVEPTAGATCRAILRVPEFVLHSHLLDGVA